MYFTINVTFIIIFSTELRKQKYINLKRRIRSQKLTFFLEEKNNFVEQNNTSEKAVLAEEKLDSIAFDDTEKLEDLDKLVSIN